jgi:hypothetical protein
VCGVEEYFLSADTELRLRYMTRFSPEERWAYASAQPRLDDRLGLLADQFLPIADFGLALREAALQQPGLTARRLVMDVPLPGSVQARLSAMRYPWGFPPPWDDPEVRRRMDASWQAPVKWDPPTRAWHLVSGMNALPGGLEQLDALARGLERRGLRVILTEMPYEQPLVAALEHQEAFYDQYKTGLRAYMKATGRSVLPAPSGLSSQYFYDLDHLNPVGATRMAAWIKRRLTVRPEPGEDSTFRQGGRL